MEKDYEKIKVHYVTAKEAVAIANSNVGLKNAIYKEAAKKDFYYGLTLFYEFKVKLVKWGSYFAWHLKLTKGEWGAAKYKRIFGIRFRHLLLDGYFLEDCNINCLVKIDDGEFIYLKEEDLKYIKEADIGEYNEYIKSDSFYIRETTELDEM